MAAPPSLLGSLRQSLAPEARIPRGPGRPAGVLVPLRDEPDPVVVFTKRTDTLSRHAGEISFPGGLRHAEDPDLMHTALRESEEELGIPASSVDVLGFLDPLHTFVTGIWITPVVGALRDTGEFRPNPAEIADVLEFPVSRLLEVERERTWEQDGRSWTGYVYDMDGSTIWGATGRILHDLLVLLAGSTR